MANFSSDKTTGTASHHAVLAGFLGWTLDAFDFFVVIFLFDTLAHQFGVTKKDIVLTTFLILRAMVGIGMGGEWGVGASLAMEAAPKRLRGILSGLLQSGYPIGN